MSQTEPAADKKGGLFGVLFGRRVSWARFGVDCAVLIAVGYAAAHWAGWREYTCIISGTSPTGGPIDGSMIFKALLYVTLYAGFVLVAPILLLAAGFFTAFQWLRSRHT